MVKLTKLQRGRLFISKEDIKSKLGLTEDTIVNSVVSANGDIEFEVIASSENDKEWLTENTNSEWNIRRQKLDLSVSKIINTEVTIDDLFKSWLEDFGYHRAVLISCCYSIKDVLSMTDEDAESEVEAIQYEI